MERQVVGAVERQVVGAVERQVVGARSRCDRGQSVPMVAALLWVVVVLAVVLAALGARAVDRARAQAAADAVVLGVAAGGDASALAGANHATVLSLSADAEVDAVVDVGGAQAAARARAPRPGWQGLDPGLQAALGAAEALLGRPIPIVSGLRSRADQERLWANRETNPYPVAPPGTSMHERGLAVDVPLASVADLAAVAPAVGLCQPLPVSDPVHFVLCG